MSTVTQKLSWAKRFRPRMPWSGSWTVSGNGVRKERRLFKSVFLYWQHTTQKWSPNLTEHERERGIRIGHRRFVMIETVCQFHDGKEPRIKHGRF